MSDAFRFNKLLTEFIQTEGISRNYSKTELLIREGDREDHIYYIVSGSVRVFLLSEFEEMTIRFGYAGSIINSLSSFYSGRPSEFFIEAMKKTEVRMITRDQCNALIGAGEENMRGYIALLELLVTQQIEREVDLLTASPGERLRRVLARSPNLFQEVSLKYIASYLRMTPETLSRVRNS
jgi:CRP-like cAMP-binding protein